MRKKKKTEQGKGIVLQSIRFTPIIEKMVLFLAKQAVLIQQMNGPTKKNYVKRFEETATTAGTATAHHLLLISCSFFHVFA